MQTVHDISLWLLKCSGKTGYPVGGKRGTQPAAECRAGHPACLRAQGWMPSLPQSSAPPALALPIWEQLTPGCWERRYSPRSPVGSAQLPRYPSLPFREGSASQGDGQWEGEGEGWGGCSRLWQRQHHLWEQRTQGKVHWERGSVPRRDEAAPRAVCHQRMTAPRTLWLPLLAQPLIQVSRGRAVLHVLARCSDVAQQHLWPCATPRSHRVTQKSPCGCQGQPWLAGHPAGERCVLFILGLSAVIHGKCRKSMDNPMYKRMGHGYSDRGGHGGTVPTEDTGCPSCPRCGLGQGLCRQHRPAAREARGHPGCPARR